jgi:hypothetical protein
VNLHTGVNGTNGVGYGNATIINQNLSITTPKALSEKELAREFKSMSQQLKA